MGSLLKTNSLVTHVLHKVAMAIENDSKLTENERKNLRVRFDEITPMRILDDYNSPFYLHRCMKKDLYMVTNRLADLIMQKSPCGIRYCSCFIPTEMSGGTTNNYPRRRDRRKLCFDRKRHFKFEMVRM